MRDYVLIVAGKSISAIAQMVMLVYLATALPAERLAILLAVYSIASVVAALGDLGLGTLGMRERATGHPVVGEQAFRAADTVAILASLGGVLSLIAASFVEPLLLASIPLMIWAPAERSTETRGLRLIADGKVARVAILSGARRLLGLVVFLMLASVLPSDLAFTAALGSVAIAALIVVRRWAPLDRIETRGSLSALIKRALPFTFTSVSGQMRNLDVPIITGLIGGASAAAYGLGSRVASPVLLIFSSISSLVLVRVHRFSAAQFHLLVAALLVAPGIVFFALMLGAPKLAEHSVDAISWLSVENSRIMAIVAGSYMYAGAGIIFGSICVAMRSERVLMWVNTSTAAAALMSVTIVGSTLGSASVAAAITFCCYVLQALVLAYFVMARRRGRERHDDD